MKDEKTCNYSSFYLHPSAFEFRPRSSGVERLLGKEEVMSSNLIAGSSRWKIGSIRPLGFTSPNESRDERGRMSFLIEEHQEN